MLFVVLLTRPGHQGEALREPRVRQHLRISIILLLRRNYSETPVPINSSRERDRKGFLYLSETCRPMGRANNECQCCSSKAQHIFHSVADIM